MLFLFTIHLCIFSSRKMTIKNLLILVLIPKILYKFWQFWSNLHCIQIFLVYFKLIKSCFNIRNMIASSSLLPHFINSSKLWVFFLYNWVSTDNFIQHIAKIGKVNIKIESRFTVEETHRGNKWFLGSSWRG